MLFLRINDGEELSPSGANLSQSTGGGEPEIKNHLSKIWLEKKQQNTQLIVEKIKDDLQQTGKPYATRL